MIHGDFSLVPPLLTHYYKIVKMYIAVHEEGDQLKITLCELLIVDSDGSDDHDGL